MSDGIVCRQSGAGGKPVARAHYVALGVTCAFIIAVYAWSAKSGFLELWGGSARQTYYSLVVGGFCAGHFNLNKEAPAGLAQLPDPYDPAANGLYRSLDRLHDLSYHRGKLYLYFGVTPVLVLFWPWRELTGHFLWHRGAVLIFCAVGFLSGAGLLVAMWRRYFAEVSVGVVLACLAGLGLASATLPLLARSDVYEVAISCGFMLTLLTLLLVWRALHATRGRGGWLAGASLAYGLAVGARPSLLFGAIILLVPVVQKRRTAQSRVLRSFFTHLLAATGPITIIGLGLMFYNDLRFDSPFEFGQSYQLASDRQAAIQHFSLNYLWFNLRVYFLSMAAWGGQFPFVRDIAMPALPLGHAEVEHAFGVLPNVPVVLMAFAAPLAWRGLAGEGRSVLRWFGMGLAALFGATAMTLGFYSYTIVRYQVEFLAPLMVLAVMGILGTERTLGSDEWRVASDRISLPGRIRFLLPGTRHLKLVARSVCGLMLLWSVAFNLLARYPLYSQTCYDLGLNVLQIGPVTEAIAHFQKALDFQPANPKARNELGTTLFDQGQVTDAVRCLELAVQFQPQDAEARSNLGVMLFRLGRIPEAMAQYEQALRLDPGRVTARYNLGNALFRLGRITEAIEQYELALRLKPDYEAARRNLGVARLQLGSEGRPKDE